MRDKYIEFSVLSAMLSSAEGWECLRKSVTRVLGKNEEFESDLAFPLEINQGTWLATKNERNAAMQAATSPKSAFACSDSSW